MVSPALTHGRKLASGWWVGANSQPLGNKSQPCRRRDTGSSEKSSNKYGRSDIFNSINIFTANVYFNARNLVVDTVFSMRFPFFFSVQRFVFVCFTVFQLAIEAQRRRINTVFQSFEKFHVSIYNQRSRIDSVYNISLSVWVKSRKKICISLPLWRFLLVLFGSYSPSELSPTSNTIFAVYREKVDNVSIEWTQTYRCKNAATLNSICAFESVLVHIIASWVFARNLVWNKMPATRIIVAHFLLVWFICLPPTCEYRYTQKNNTAYIWIYMSSGIQWLKITEMM